MKISEISGQNFLKYFQNRLSSEEKKNISEIAAGERLLSDAIEGFENQPDALNDFNVIKNRFYFNKGIRQKIANKYILFLAGFIAIVFSCLVIYFKVKTPDVFKKNVIVSENSIIQPLQNNLMIQENEFLNASPIAAEIQITSKSVVKNQPKPIVVETINDANNVSPIQSKKIQNVSPKTSVVDIEKELDKKLITYSNFPVIYLVDLKTVDYSKVYKNRTVAPEPGGLESKFESSESKTVFTFENKTHFISYKVFLETALQKYADADFKGAIRDFSTILKTFPADLNAYFYGGLCMYNLQKSDKAISYFDQVIESPINSFRQEAKWYKALSLIQKKDSEKATQLLSEIIDESGFYTDKAKSLLKILK